MADLQYRAATPTDIDAFLALQKEVYGRAPKAEHILWKYFAPLANYTEPRLWVAAQNDGRLLAAGGATVYPFYSDGAETLAASLMDYLVVKEARRQGITLSIHEKLCATLANANVTHCFNMPSELGLRMCAAVKQENIFPIPWIRRRVSLLTLLRDRAATTPNIVAGPPPDAALHALWQRLKPAVNNCSIPTPAWLSYRYQNVPDKSYRFHLAQDTEGPCGLLITGQRLFKGRPEAVIAYLVARNHDTATFHTLLNALARDTRRAGQSGIRTVAGDSPAQRARWQAAHFTRATGEFLMHARDLRGDLSPTLRTPDSFLPCLGDHDFV